MSDFDHQPAPSSQKVPTTRSSQADRLALWDHRLIHLLHLPLLGQAIIALAWLRKPGKIFWSIVGAAIIGNYAYALVTTGPNAKNNADLSQFVLVLWAKSHLIGVGVIAFLVLCILLASWLQHAATRATERRQVAAQHENERLPYVLKLVSQLDPNKGPYIHQYIESVYLFRQADHKAREALRQAATRSGPLPLGICVFGRPMQGKTRLAWEAMRSELPDWTLIKWPHQNTERLDFTSLRGQRVVLWLDDLHEYTAPQESLSLGDLPSHFAEAGIQLIVVATCRDGKEKTQAVGALSKLLEQLIAITINDMSSEDADQLTILLGQSGKEAQREQFDGTPGSLVLGIDRMRDRFYTLAPNAQRLLRAMRLVHSIRIFSYAPSRLRSIAVDVYGLDANSWQDAQEAVIQAGFARMEPVSTDEGVALAPRAAIYLERAVPDVSPGTDVTHDWPRLQTSLIGSRDAFALNRLGIALHLLLLGDIRQNRQRSIACFLEALKLWIWEQNPVDWAIAQVNLGAAYHMMSELETGDDHVRFLSQAEVSLQTALAVVTKEQYPGIWALAQYNLGIVLGSLAKRKEGADRKNLLNQAVLAFQHGLEVDPRYVQGGFWVNLLETFINTLWQQAELAEGSTKRQILRQLIRVLQAALEIYTPDIAPAERAAIEHKLGSTLGWLAELTNEDTERLALFEQSIEASRLAVNFYAETDQIATWGSALSNLARALSGQATMLKGAIPPSLVEVVKSTCADLLKKEAETIAHDERTAELRNMSVLLLQQSSKIESEARAPLLQQAVAGFQEILSGTPPEEISVEKAEIQESLGRALLELSELAEQSTRGDLLNLAEIAFRAAIKGYTPTTTPTQWTKAYQGLAEVLIRRTELAEGFEQLKLFEETIQALKATLEALTQESNPAGWAWQHFTIGTLRFRQALLLPEEAAVMYLQESIAELKKAVNVHAPELAPEQRNQIQLQLADSLGLFAVLMEHIRQQQEYPPENTALFKMNAATVYLERAIALETEDNDEAYQALQKAEQCILEALTFFTADTALDNYLLSVQLREEIYTRLAAHSRAFEHVQEEEGS